jgi:hypothetical protein
MRIWATILFFPISIIVCTLPIIIWEIFPASVAVFAPPLWLFFILGIVTIILGLAVHILLRDRRLAAQGTRTAESAVVGHPQVREMQEAGWKVGRVPQPQAAAGSPVRSAATQAQLEKTMVATLNALRGLIAVLPERFPRESPPESLVFGTGYEQAKQQIPIICRNIDEAIHAIQTGSDPHGNPITKPQIADGLRRLVAETRKPAFATLLSFVLNPEGIKELADCMNQLERAANIIGTWR